MFAKGEKKGTFCVNECRESPSRVTNIWENRWPLILSFSGKKYPPFLSLVFDYDACRWRYFFSFSAMYRTEEKMDIYCLRRSTLVFPPHHIGTSHKQNSHIFFSHTHHRRKRRGGQERWEEKRENQSPPLLSSSSYSLLRRKKKKFTRKSCKNVSVFVSTYFMKRRFKNIYNSKSFLFVPNWLWRILHAMDKEGNKESEMEMMMAGISLFSFPLLFHRGRRSLLSIEGGGCSHAKGFFIIMA